jgi:putative ubiquitin-RnfH superfamily antitoxin RatB of RatAB toxin-antitoxin module
MADKLTVDIVYAMADIQHLRRLALPPGSTAADALARVGDDPAFAGIDFVRAEIGIFGRRIDAATALSDGDRVEIYRKLRIDPKEARRVRSGVRRGQTR